MRKTLKRDLIAVIWTLLVTYAIGKWAFHLAYIERGYEAVGGEYLLTGYFCDGCGAEINERVYEYSLNKFGRPLCMKCQKGAGK